MVGTAQNTNVLRFGVFELDLQAGELRKSGVKIKLQEQPFQILSLLLQRPGQVVTREEIRQHLWPADTFVDFDHSLNSAVKKLRQALGDDSDNARFIETLPRRGYRLIVPVWPDVPAAGAQISQGVAPASTNSSKRAFYYGFAFAALVVIAAGAVVLWKTANSGSSPPRVLGFTQLTNDGQAKFGPLTTDGSRIYFNELLPGLQTRIVQVSINGGEVVPIAVPLKRARLADLSSDGSVLLLANDDVEHLSSLWTQPVAGGSPRRLGTFVASDGEFGPSADSVIYNTDDGVYLTDRNAGSASRLRTLEGDPFFFKFSPNAKFIRFTTTDDRFDPPASIMEMSADGSGLRKLATGCCGKWSTDGRYYVYENRSGGRTDLWAMRESNGFSPGLRESKPIQLTAGPLNFLAPLSSRDGKLLYAIGDSPRSEVIRYDVQTLQYMPFFSGISAEGLDFAKDGQWVTYTSYPDGSLWCSKLDGTERLQLTFPPMRALLPRWSPDRKQIAFNAIVPGGTWNIYLIPSDGGTPERILPSEHGQMDAFWSPDGKSLVFGSLDVPGTPISTIDVKSRKVSTLPGSTGLFSPRWSPDGRYVAAINAVTPQKLMIFDFVTQKWAEGYGSDIGYLSWSHDGKYIYFKIWHDPALNIDERIAKLRVSDLKIESTVAVQNLGRLTAGTFEPWFGLAPDDSPLFARDIGTQEIYAVAVQWP